MTQTARRSAPSRPETDQRLKEVATSAPVPIACYEREPDKNRAATTPAVTAEQTSPATNLSTTSPPAPSEGSASHDDPSQPAAPQSAAPQLAPSQPAVAQLERGSRHEYNQTIAPPATSPERPLASVQPPFPTTSFGPHQSQTLQYPSLHQYPISIPVCGTMDVFSSTGHEQHTAENNHFEVYGQGANALQNHPTHAYILPDCFDDLNDDAQLTSAPSNYPPLEDDRTVAAWRNAKRKHKE
ncbi:hypothetical protein H2200_012434 [Cladophialophora chaetospira]|uniref:Uncharacterized protein n=1 Tax=Cladophialophora chaetospira TaxID=386627 RepID=A0AA39CCE2_9EURO|nr:hypothetical protein H2200_012434 [Cladophialophora chaetospira]